MSNHIEKLLKGEIEVWHEVDDFGLHVKIEVGEATIRVDTTTEASGLAHMLAQLLPAALEQVYDTVEVEQ